MIKKVVTLIAIVCLTTLLTGCPTLAPHTCPYRPSSEWEANELSTAQFNIFPDDVRSDLNKFQESKVAWVGIITDSKL